MNIDRVREIFETHLKDNWSKTPIAYPNVPYRAKPDESYLACYLLPGQGDVISLGHSAWNRWSGIFQINVFGALNLGSKPVLEWGGELVDLFYGMDTDGLQTRTPYLEQLGQHEQHFAVSVTVPFIYDEKMTAK